jgi:hypothetical protein
LHFVGWINFTSIIDINSKLWFVAFNVKIIILHIKFIIRLKLINLYGSSVKYSQFILGLIVLCRGNGRGQCWEGAGYQKKGIKYTQYLSSALKDCVFLSFMFWPWVGLALCFTLHRLLFLKFSCDHLLLYFTITTNSFNQSAYFLSRIRLNKKNYYFSKFLPFKFLINNISSICF